MESERWLLVLGLFIIFISFVSATCSSGQININSANLTQLDNLYGVGPAKAQAIISARPYFTVSDLVNASGIGPKTLQGIENQGLACVEKNSSANNVKGNTSAENFLIINAQNSSNSSDVIKKTEVDTSPITLSSPKDIKTSKPPQVLGTIDYSKYSIVIFCILLLLLYVLKPKKKKNEFRH